MLIAKLDLLASKGTKEILANLLRVQEQNKQMLDEGLSKDNYSKSARKKLRSTMYDLRKRR